MTSFKVTNAYSKDDSRVLALIAALVTLSGILTLGSLLFSLLGFKHVHIERADAQATLLAGLSLIYLATLLNRGKRNAWLVSLPIYLFLVLRNARHYFVDFPHSMHGHSLAVLNLLIPAATLILLITSRSLFTVRSELRSFTTALSRSVIILIVAFVYGVVGFSVMDEHDFHQEISPPTAAHYTVDQFNLTTNQQVVAYSKRAVIFVDSLAVVSVAALFYVSLAFFSPIRFRLGSHEKDKEDMRRLMKNHASTSEDFFKLWPPDKAYFFNRDRSAGLAYKATHGVALIVGDPLGSTGETKGLINEFMSLCRLNDWRPALIHTEQTNIKLYTKLGFEIQKIGEEAIISTNKFVEQVATTKDFRHINNKFSKLGYSTSLLEPPHSPELLQQLRIISDDWLGGPGRAERGFMMGYFSTDYMQQCKIMVVKDDHHQVRGFINQVPSPTPAEANFDFLRHSKSSPGNINDFLMLNFIISLHQQGIPKLNMGLSPLVGLEENHDNASNRLNSFLNFAYANGNRFYSFQGLKRFKTKYQPEWESRYIVYRGGVRGFTKTINALIFAMRIRSARKP